MQRESESSLAALKVALASPNIKVCQDTHELSERCAQCANIKRVTKFRVRMCMSEFHDFNLSRTQLHPFLPEREYACDSLAGAGGRLAASRGHARTWLRVLLGGGSELDKNSKRFKLGVL